MDLPPQFRENIRPFAPLTIQERIRMFTAQPFVRLCVGIVAVALVGGYFFASQASSQPLEASRVETTATTFAPTTQSIATTMFKVYVAGEVNAPGVVDVDSKARIADAIEKAGGPTSNADIIKCDMAAFVVDGATIFIPSRNDSARISCSGAQASSAATPNGASGSSGSLQGKINLNTATQTEIETLPGVGPTLGAAIIAYREQHGSFASVADLQKVKGIGDGRFADLKDLVTV